MKSLKIKNYITYLLIIFLFGELQSFIIEEAHSSPRRQTKVKPATNTSSTTPSRDQTQRKEKSRRKPANASDKVPEGNEIIPDSPHLISAKEILKELELIAIELKKQEELRQECIDDHLREEENKRIQELKEIEERLNFTGLPYELFKGACNKFINEDGTIGPHGTAVLNAIKKVDDEDGACFYNGGIDISELCPRFEEFSKLQKDHFWVWVFASMAKVESTCQSYAIGPAKYLKDIAVGYFQLEGTTNQRRGSARDPDFCKLNNKNEAETIEFISKELKKAGNNEAREVLFMSLDTDDKNLWLSFQTECAVSIMKDFHCDGKADWPIPPKNGVKSYWAKLNTQKGRISKLINQHPACN